MNFKIPKCSSSLKQNRRYDIRNHGTLNSGPTFEATEFIKLVKNFEFQSSEMLKLPLAKSKIRNPKKIVVRIQDSLDIRIHKLVLNFEFQNFEMSKKLKAKSSMGN